MGVMNLRYVLLLSLMPGLAVAQSKPTLTPDQFGQWEVIKELRTTPDGAYQALELERMDGRKRMVWKKRDADTAAVVDGASQVQFSNDSHFMAYLTGTTVIVKHVVTGMAVSVESAMRVTLYPGIAVIQTQKAEKTGVTLVNLASTDGSMETHALPGVSRVFPSPDGKWMVSFVSAPDGNEVDLVQLANGETRVIYRGEEEPAEVRWAHDGSQGFLVTKQSSQNEVRLFRTSDKRVQWFDRLNNFPRGYRVVAARGFEAGPDANWLTFGITRQYPWNSTGVRVSRTDDPSTRGMRALREECDLGLWNPQTGFTTLETPEQRRALVFADGTVLTEKAKNPLVDFVTIPHERTLSWGGEELKVALDDVTVDPLLSPNKKVAFAFAQGVWWQIRPGKVTRLNYTGQDSKANQWRLKTPLSRPVWVGATGDAILAFSNELVLVREDGIATSLIQSPTPTTFELVGVARPGQPWPVWMHDGNRSELGVVQPGKPYKQIEAGPYRYDRAEVTDTGMFYVRRNFSTSPEIRFAEFGGGNATLFSTNPQQENFAWGKAERVTYLVGKQPSQGLLIYPASFEAGKKYPLVAHMYEKQAEQRANSYFWPDPNDAYNVQAFSQDGFFVFLPDVEFELGKPGDSAVKSLESALREAFKKEPAINAERVGLMGHSWGGYESAYCAIKSPLVRCAVAGAPIVDFSTLALTDHLASGIPNAAILEESQGRLGASVQQSPALYASNSLLGNLKSLTKPLLVAFGSEDKVVQPWQQSLLFTECRNRGILAYLLEYPGENHLFGVRANQVDYANKVRGFFRTYLKGVLAEPWMGGNQ